MRFFIPKLLNMGGEFNIRQLKTIVNLDDNNGDMSSKVFCCEDCFRDSFLTKYIRKYGNKGYCNFCKKKNKFCIEPYKLEDLFKPVVNLYTPIIDFMPTHDLKNWDGQFIWDKLQEDWEIFSSDDNNIQEELLINIFPKWQRFDPKEPDSPYLDNWVEDEDNYFGTKEEFSDEIIKEWENFCEELLYRNRFFLNINKLTNEIEDLLNLCEIEYQKGGIFYRARISNEKKFAKKQMGKPPREETINGRGNPEGISYLYLASDEKTAISEVKPYVMNKITIGKFKSIDKIKIIDLRKRYIDSPFKYGDKLEKILRYLGFLRKLGDELSKPILPRPSNLEYLPSQYLCELIKKNGYDGVVYRSYLGAGYNLMIFNDQKLKCVKTWRCEVKGINLEYE